MKGRVLDLSPVMEPISKQIQTELRDRLERGGDGDWPENAPSTVAKKGSSTPGVGEHGGFAPTIQRAWSARNAVALTRAPHAHLFDEGTVRHLTHSGSRVSVYSEGGKHVSRAESRKRLHGTNSRQHSPAYPFAYLSDGLQELAGDEILDFVIGERYQ
jgi:hypothetical protein